MYFVTYTFIYMNDSIDVYIHCIFYIQIRKSMYANFSRVVVRMVRTGYSLLGIRPG
jgi:hypothetical protein